MAAHGELALPEELQILLWMAMALMALFIGAMIGDMLAALSKAQGRRKTAVLWVKSPLEMELKPARLARTGEILVADGKETWVYKPPPGYKPVELRVGGRLYKAYIVDKNVHAFYEMPELREEELEQEVEVQGRRVKLNRVMLDPRTLYTYIGSKSMERLIRPLKVGKGEAFLYMAVGGLMVLLMIFFLLPILGYQVSIGGGGVFG